MPATPFHFGPAMLLKAVIPDRFSLFIFCYSQVVMDLEVVYKILVSHQLPLHGLSHSYLGAFLLGFSAELPGVMGIGA
jgi:hypothetical protein